MDIIRDYIPKGRINRPAIHNPCEYITIHNTGNTNKGANTLAHINYLKTLDSKVSCHYTVDDKNIAQHLPDNETAYHAGKGLANGHSKSIGLEIYVNS